MSDIDLAVRQCKELETILRTKHGAEGKGLHQLVTSVERHLSPDLIRVLRRVATIRNKIVHESDYERLDEKKRFLANCAEAKKQLKRLKRGTQRRSRPRRLGIVLIVLVVVTAIVAYGFGWTDWFR